MDAKQTAHVGKSSQQKKGGHSHSHAAPANMGGRLVVALVLTALFVVGEFIAGLFANSLALISDAGHNLSDALALGLSFGAMQLARRRPTPDKTFGFFRAGILAAALNAGTLVLIALFIFYEALQRFLQPQPVEGGIIIVVAAVAMLLNAAIALSLRAGSDDINVRSAFIHMLGDAISAFGVILAGIGILLTGWQVLDPLVSVLIGLFILWSSWGIVKEAANILMEGTPEGLNVRDLIADMNSVEGVQSVHDVHVWTIGHDKRALSAHVNTGNCSVMAASQVFDRLNQLLETRYDIVHSTLQPECLECDPNARYCSLSLDEVQPALPEKSAAHTHTHEDGSMHTHRH